MLSEGVPRSVVGVQRGIAPSLVGIQGFPNTVRAGGWEEGPFILREISHSSLVTRHMTSVILNGVKNLGLWGPSSLDVEGQRRPSAAPAPPQRRPSAAPAPPQRRPSAAPAPPQRRPSAAPAPPQRRPSAAPAPPQRRPSAAPAPPQRRPSAAPAPPQRRPSAAPAPPQRRPRFVPPLLRTTIKTAVTNDQS